MRIIGSNVAIVRVRLETTFKDRPEGGEMVNCTPEIMWGLGPRTCKGLAKETCIECLKMSRKPSGW